MPPLALYNTLGFHPQGPKKLFVSFICDPDAKFRVVDRSGCEVHCGAMTLPQRSEISAWDLQCADFSDLQIEGDFQIEIDGFDSFFAIKISSQSWNELGKALVKAFYFQRASIPLDSRFAGPWSREAGHFDQKVFIHSSAADRERPQGTEIASPKGWYDAGDYNKYIVNSGISVWTLLAIAEHYPQCLSKIQLNIPESGGPLPDLLAEVRWNLDWMSSMQAPDGGVYHKLTNLRFDPMVMPEQCHNDRYVVMKTTTASFDFAASMAQASRVYRQWLPDQSKLWLQQSIQAYQWAITHSDQLYRQPEDVRTGRYEDERIQDNWQWAALELWITTGEDLYLQQAQSINHVDYGVPNWQSVGSLGLISAAILKKLPWAMTTILNCAQDLLKQQNQSAECVAMQPRDYYWGSNSVAANQGLILLAGYLISGDSQNIKGAVHQLDYLLGRNPLCRSFVTGYGHNPPMHPHHRPSESDGILDPVPGLLVGGPNPGRQDALHCPDYLASPPALAYIDHLNSYATNEVAINWNAPMAYLTLGLECVLTPESMM